MCCIGIMVEMSNLTNFWNFFNSLNSYKWLIILLYLAGLTPAWFLNDLLKYATSRNPRIPPIASFDKVVFCKRDFASCIFLLAMSWEVVLPVISLRHLFRWLMWMNKAAAKSPGNLSVTANLFSSTALNCFSSKSKNCKAILCEADFNLSLLSSILKVTYELNQRMSYKIKMKFQDIFMLNDMSIPYNTDYIWKQLTLFIAYPVNYLQISIEA